MKVPAVFYSSELNCFVIIHKGAKDTETNELCTPIEWDHKDLVAATVILGADDEPFLRGNFIYIGDL